MRRALLLLVAFLIGACTNDRPGISRESKRLWGRDRLTEETEKKAKETLDPYTLGENEELRHRVLSMSFEEVVARMSFVEYKGTAKFELSNGGHTLSIVEDTTITHGLNGSFRVLQLDGDGEIARETIYNNGVFFVRNGGGDMRVQGIIKDQHLIVRDEAWQPLRVYTGYYGPRLGLKKVGSTSAEGRSAAKYKFVLLTGADLIDVPGQGSKRPLEAAGDLWVDEQTGVPIKVSFRGVLEVPAKKGDKAGRLELALDFGIHQIEGVEIKPKSFVPTIRRHPVDLEPLAFLDGGTRTSTVIGGKKPKATKPPPSEELPAKLSTSTTAEKH